MSKAMSQLAKAIVQKISNNNANKITNAKTDILQTVEQTSVNKAIRDVLDVDINGLATRNYVGTYVEEHMPNININELATQDYVGTYVEEHMPNIDLTQYSKTEEINELLNGKVSSEDVDSLMQNYLSDYVLKNKLFSDNGNGQFKVKENEQDNSVKVIDMSTSSISNNMITLKANNAAKNSGTGIAILKQFNDLSADMIMYSQDRSTGIGNRLVFFGKRGIFYLKDSTTVELNENREVSVKEDIDALREEINNTKLDNDSIANSDSLGLIKIGQNITNEEGTISITKNNVTSALGYEPPTFQQVDQAIANLVNSAPETLSTLNDLAEALGNDPSFSTTIMTMIGEKLGKTETAVNAEKVNNLTVETAVPFNAKFTDTTYEEATTTAAGLMSAEDKAKLNSIEENANNFIMPTATNNRFGAVKIGNNITILEGRISVLDNDVINALGYMPLQQTDVDGLLDSLIDSAPDDLNTLGKIANTINNYQADLNNKIDRSETVPNSERVNNLTVETAVPANAVFTDTTYDVATQSNDGLMSANDKAKLDSIPDGGYSSGGGDDSYVLPNATATVLGGVKIGDNITSESGRISVTKTNITTALGYEPPTTENVEMLVSNLVNSAPETLDTLNELANAIGNDPSFAITITGLIANKLGKTETAKDSEKVNGLTVETAVPAGAKFTDTTYDVATSSTNGLMSATDKAKLDSLNGSGDYVLPTATDTTLGGVKVGSNITNTDGVISVSKTNITTALGYEPPTLSRVEELVAGLVDSAPETLDTLKEVADALGNDPNFATTITGLLANKLGRTETAANAEKVNGLTVEKAVPADAVFTDTTYEEATTTVAGLMSAADKIKLDGISGGAGEYNLPTADTSTLGGVKIGNNITNVDGVISINKNNVTTALGYEPPTTQNVQELIDALVDSAPDTLNTLNELATALGNNPDFATTVTELIGSKLGKTETAKDSEKVNGLTVETAVPANAKFTDTTYEEATSTTAGLMSATDKAKLDTINGNYTLPEATSSILGGVKVGNNITVSDGTISITGTNVTDALGFTPLDATATASNAEKVNNLTVQTAVPENALFTDMNVKNEASDTTAAYITGTTSNVTNTGTQVFDTNVYLTSTAGRLHVGSLELGSGIILL